MRPVLVLPLPLLAGCAPPPVAETTAGITALVIAFLIPLLAAAVFSVLTAWGLIAASQARRLTWGRPGAVRAGLATLIAGACYAALGLGSGMLIHTVATQPDAAPLVWLTWPGPTTPGGAVLLVLAGVVMLGVGGGCLLARPPA